MKKLSYLTVAITILALSTSLWASDKYNRNNEIQRKAKGVVDNQENTLSNFEFMASNNGIIGLDQYNATGTGIWPRGTQNKYLFAGGFWFGAQKKNPNTDEMQNYVTISYNPNNGQSWFAPGSIADGDNLDPDLKDKQRLYMSTDFNQYTGKPFDYTDGPDWPLWITDQTKIQYGAMQHKYENDIDKRNKTEHPDGPMFVSEEDIVSIFKDTDLYYYDGGTEVRKMQGYPLGLEVESRIYTWEKENMKDVVVHSYLLTNKSNDVLTNCYFAGVYDVDIAYAPDASSQARNDRIRYYDEDKSKNLAVAWTDTDLGESGKGFGYIGISLLETPAVDDEKFVRNEASIIPRDEQVGTITFRNWAIEEDLPEDDQRYNFMSSGLIDGDTGPGDKRLLISTGPFNMMPGDVCRVAFAITFAMPAKGGEADGTYEDISGLTGKNSAGIQSIGGNSLIDKIERTTDEYYNLVTGIGGKGDISDFKINRVFPNPASNEFNIEYSLSNTSMIRITLADQLGNDVLSLDNSIKNAGTVAERYLIDTDNLSSGIYFLKLDNGNEIITKKIAIIND